MATPITRYAIAIPDADVAELSARLKQTRWPDEYANQDWSYGTRLDYLKALLEYWHTDFDWRSQEARLNRWPQRIGRTIAADMTDVAPNGRYVR